METLVKPIFLFADSQLLFWHTEEGSFLSRVRQALSDGPIDWEPKAAYIGASNGDAPEFFDLFVAAMDGIAIHDCRMIPSAPSEEDYAYLNEADIIMLAGGDTAKGWNVFRENGLVEQIIARYAVGTILMGVSAGAVQLGLKGSRDPESESPKTFDTFRLVPYVIDVHAESTWRHLRRIVLKIGEDARGIGIPAGGGAIFHPDWTLEPIRHPLTEFTLTDEGITQSLLLPPDPSAPEQERVVRQPLLLPPGTEVVDAQDVPPLPNVEADGEDGDDVESDMQL